MKDSCTLLTIGIASQHITNRKRSVGVMPYFKERGTIIICLLYRLFANYSTSVSTIFYHRHPQPAKLLSHPLPDIQNLWPPFVIDTLILVVQWVGGGWMNGGGSGLPQYGRIGYVPLSSLRLPCDCGLGTSITANRRCISGWPFILGQHLIIISFF